LFFAEPIVPLQYFGESKLLGRKKYRENNPIIINLVLK
jgi:hypothetical protein